MPVVFKNKARLVISKQKNRYFYCEIFNKIEFQKISKI